MSYIVQSNNSLVDNLPSTVTDKVLQDASRQLELPVSELRIVQAENQTWADGCLGLPRPGEICTEALVAGYRVTIEGRQQLLVYRTDTSGSQFRLEPAVSPSNLQANLFELQGYDTQITYSSTSITGVPQLSYLKGETSRTFSGVEEIQLAETGLGQSVTVLLQNGAADEPIESLTLLLPIVQLSPQQQPLSIVTIGILSRRAVFVNPTTPAQLQTYDTLSLYGTAQLVNF